MKTRLAAAGLLAVLGGPLVWSLWRALQAGLEASAWHALINHPQTAPALGMALWTGLAATALAVVGAAGILSRRVGQRPLARLLRFLAPMLAVPHAAFAIGLAFLLAPSGWLLRALSPWATGLSAPPPWTTTQDPWGLGLIAVLVLKEIPFLLWMAATQLQRAEVNRVWAQDLLLARSMGYTPQVAWWRVIWPQLWPRLRWPVLAVLAYSLTVVDMALVMGPTTPPTLAVLAWQWLQDGEVTQNAQGAAAAWLLTGVLALSASVAALIWQVPQRAVWRTRWTRGERGRERTRWRGAPGLPFGFSGLLWVYAVVMLALLVGSGTGLWPFPALLPVQLSGQAWASVANSLPTLGTTLSLAFCSAATALLWSVTWLECAPRAWDTRVRPLLYVPLVLPPVLWVVGVHQLALEWQIDGRWSGLWLAHTLAATPYVLVTLSPAYTGFDARYQQLSAALGHGRAVFLWRIKWPLLRSALASAWAVGFAVSVAQYLPTLFLGAGRFATVTTEAVTLAAGAQRALTSAYAVLQWGLPVLAWTLAARWGRPRRF